MHQAVLAEILEERVVSSRGRRNPRAVKRSVGKYPIRMRCPQTGPPGRLDYAKCIRIIK
jgi:hypothetical protein